MAIKILQPGLARVGMIKIGDKGPAVVSSKGNTFQPPKKLDHFSIRTLKRGEDGRLVEDTALMARLGDKPTSLHIRLPFDDIEMNCPNTLAWYKGGTRYCWGDGEEAQRLAGREGAYGPAKPYGPCGERCPDFQARRCKPFAVLRVILEEQQQVGGVYEFRTTSWNSIRNLLSAMATVKAQTGGLLAWIPLTLQLVPQTVQPKDGGTANLAYVVQLVFEGSPAQLLQTVRELLSLRAPLMQEIRALENHLKALPVPLEDTEEAADVQAEFYPEATKADAEADPWHPTLRDLTDLVKALGLTEQDLQAQMEAREGFPQKRKDLTAEQIQTLYRYFFGLKEAHVQTARPVPEESSESIEGDLEDDIPFDEPPGASNTPQDTPGGGATGAVAPEGQGEGLYATGQQVAELQLLAQQIGEWAQSDLQEFLDAPAAKHGVTQESYQRFKTYLQQKKAEMGVTDAEQPELVEGD